MRHLPTFVFVHGAFANSFPFTLLAELAVPGHRSLDAPGGPKTGARVRERDWTGRSARSTPPETLCLGCINICARGLRFRRNVRTDSLSP